MIPTKFVSVNGIKYLSNAKLKAKKDVFLEEYYKNQVAKHPIRYKMCLVLANSGDILDDTRTLERQTQRGSL